MSEERTKKRRRFWGPRRWHRYLGAVMALPLLWLCVTGLLLQHQDRLGLTEKKVSSGWLLKRYGQIPEGEPRQVKAGRFAVAEWGGVLFLEGTMLEEGGTLVGAVARPAELVVATEDELFVYDAQGAYLDRLGEESLPGVPIDGLGLAAPARVLIAAGGKTYALGEGFLEYEEVSEEVARRVVWSEAAEAKGLKKELRGALAEGSGFTWSRVVTDLHSGSLFGTVGRLLVDLTGIGVIVLTLFGIRLVFKRT